MNMLNLAMSLSTETMAGWTMILSGLSLVGVIWIVHTLQKVGKNQVEIANMLVELRGRIAGAGEESGS